VNFTVLRVTAGVLILAGMAIADLWRRGGHATRWREYAFLLLCVAVAMAYGIANDQITSRISWEYFYYGKELAPIIGSQTPPDPVALSWQAVRIGAEATWAAGLIAGVALLLANNPSCLARLSFAQLAARLPSFVILTALFAVLGGIAGHYLLLCWISNDLHELADTNLWRPHRFLEVYGIHLGGYVGGGVATIYNVYRVHQARLHKEPA
jgi:hypothetical protein